MCITLFKVILNKFLFLKNEVLNGRFRYRKLAFTLFIKKAKNLLLSGYHSDCSRFFVMDILQIFVPDGIQLFQLILVNRGLFISFKPLFQDFVQSVIDAQMFFYIIGVRHAV